MKIKLNYHLRILFLILSIVKMYNSNRVYSQSLPYKLDLRKYADNIMSFPLSDLGMELQYVPLETTSECLIRHIDKIVFTKSYIFISEIDKLFQFDINGKFIKKIGSIGRGPGEYLSVIDFCIDEQIENIYIISSGQLLVFNFEGTFINSYKLSFRPSQIINIDNSSFMFHLFNMPDPANGDVYSWYITDKKGVTLARIKNHLKRVSRPGLIVGDTPFYMFGNTPHFMEFGIDTLYFFQGKIKQPYAIFNFGNLKMNPDPLITSANRKEVARQLKDKLFIDWINENNDYLFFELHLGLSDSTLNSIYNKRTNEICILKDKGFKNNIDEGLTFWPKHFSNDLIIDYIDSFDLLKFIKKNNEARKMKISNEIVNLGKRLNEDSNPVLIILKKP